MPEDRDLISPRNQKLGKARTCEAKTPEYTNSGHVA
jgi:hypothetical protein